MIQKNFNAGTDVAAIGVWDSMYCDDKFKEKKFRDYYNNLPIHAKARRVFFVNTGSDGGYPTRLIVDGGFSFDAPHYKKWPGIWGLSVKSGKVTVGGLEDFLSSNRQITSENDDVEISSGEYSVEFYERIAEENDDDYADCESLNDKEKAILKWHGRLVPVGCIWMTFSLVALLFNWMIGLGFIVSSFIYFIVLNKVFAHLRLTDINNKIKKDEMENPVFVIVLQAISTPIEGGHVELR